MGEDGFALSDLGVTWRFLARLVWVSVVSCEMGLGVGLGLCAFAPGFLLVLGCFRLVST